jgi:hypothetical protein
MIDDGAQARRLAQQITADLQLYHPAGAPQDALIEARTLYRSRVTAAHYALFEEALGAAPPTAQQAPANDPTRMIVIAAAAIGIALAGLAAWLITSR